MAKRKVLFVKRTTSAAPNGDGGISRESIGAGESPNQHEPAASIDNNGNGSEVSGIESFDPGSIIAGEPDAGSSDAGNSGPRRRGRPRGSSNKPRAGNSSKNIEGLLFGLHSMLSAISHTPELELSDDEAEKLASAIQGVNDLYDTPVVPPWVTAWGNLAFACGGIYGPRLVAISARKTAEKQQRKPGRVTVMQPSSHVIVDASAALVEN